MVLEVAVLVEVVLAAVAVVVLAVVDVVVATVCPLAVPICQPTVNTPIDASADADLARVLIFCPSSRPCGSCQE